MSSEMVLLGIFIIFAGAKLVGELFERIGVPVLIGELFLGVAIGAVYPQIMRSSDIYQVIAQIGVIILLFSVGLETPVANLLKVSGIASLVAVLGVLFPFALGFGLAVYLGYPTAQGIFLAVSMVATSVGITARVLSDLGVLAQKESQIILGAAVVDDILGLLLLAVVTSFRAGSISWLGIGVLFLEVILFVGGLLIFGTRLANNHGHRLEKLKMNRGPLVVALIVCFGLAFLAGLIGMAAIVGAFLAGVIFAEIGETYNLRSQLKPIYEFLVPFFFVTIGFNVKLSQLASPTVIKLAVTVIILAIAGKVIGCGLAAIKLGAKSVFRIGVGMVPRGEVGILVALMGLTLGAIPSSVYSVIVIMSVATTLISPVFIKWAFRELNPSEIS